MGFQFFLDDPDSVHNRLDILYRDVNGDKIVLRHNCLLSVWVFRIFFLCILKDTFYYRLLL